MQVAARFYLTSQRRLTDVVNAGRASRLERISRTFNDSRKQKIAIFAHEQIGTQIIVTADTAPVRTCSMVIAVLQALRGTLGVGSD